MMNVTLRLGQASCARARVDTNASATESVRPAIGFIDLLLDSRTQKQIPCRSSVPAALAHYASGQLRVGTTSASPNRSRVQGPKGNIATHSEASTPEASEIVSVGFAMIPCSRARSLMVWSRLTSEVPRLLRTKDAPAMAPTVIVTPHTPQAPRRTGPDGANEIADGTA